VDAAVDHHILNVLAFNVDALRLSGYLFKPREGKLTFGPLWDFDRALGSTDGRDANPRVWRSTGGDLGTDMFNAASIFSNPWYSRMFRDIDFWQRWIDRWQELRRDQFSLTNLHGLVDSLANQLREAEGREVARWPGFTRPRGSYQSEVDRMKTWLANRVDFIDTNFLAAPVLSQPAGPLPPGSLVALSGASGATLYYTLDGTDPRARGGNVSSNARPYTGPILLNQNARIVARAWDTNHRNLTGANKPPLSSPWSGPMAATYVVTTPSLVVSEIMFHPAPPPAGDTNTPENFEFVELKNTGTSTLHLTGFTFTRGIEYAFTADSAVQSLAPGQVVVLVKNRAAFATRYPGVTNVAGEYAGSLDDSGERVTLVGPVEETVLDFTYQNQWFPTSDGQERFVAQARRTLGQPNAGPKVGPVVISEVMFEPPPIGTNDNTRDEYVELININASPVPLFDPAVRTNTWHLAGGVDFVFPTNLTLAAGQTLLVVGTGPRIGSPQRGRMGRRHGRSGSRRPKQLARVRGWHRSTKSEQPAPHRSPHVDGWQIRADIPGRRGQELLRSLHRFTVPWALAEAGRCPRRVGRGTGDGP
jgi:hypothetical protein